jgi:NADPH2:quinone reductase
MGIGTAGFTAAIAIDRMEQNGQTPEHGPIVVTGATGGVGSIAIDMLSQRGYTVVALSGKSSQSDYLTALGASEVRLRQEQDWGSRPLERAKWGGAIDNVGGDTLTWLTRTTLPWGNIAAIGLAGSVELNTTVMPFILRGVSLLGINSVLLSAERRRAIWQRIATDLKPAHLDRIVTRETAFADLPQAFDDYIDGAVTGRTLVNIHPE